MSTRTPIHRLAKLVHDHLPRYAEPPDPEFTETLMRKLVEDALRERASDIHLDPMRSGISVRFRIDGTIFDVAHILHPVAEHLVRCFKVNSDLNPAPSFVPQDSHLRLTTEEKIADLRIACAPCILGEKLTIRILLRSRVRRSLRELGLVDEDRHSIEQWLAETGGMFLAVGVVGSGKTTTLYALLNELHLMRRSITTIEDPIEYEIDTINQIEVDPRRGLTFAAGLRSILRLDPDIILLGEIRDSESAATAIEASHSGRVLLSTMHARDAAGAVTTLRDLGVPNHEIAASLTFVVAQRLVRMLCPHCRKEGKPSDSEIAWLERMGQQPPPSVWHAAGCAECDHSGYRDRIGIFEVWRLDEESYDLVRAGVDERALRKHLAATGTRSLLVNGVRKVAEGITDVAELRTKGVPVAELRDLQ